MASSECVKVMVRVRPMNSSQKARGCTKVVQVLNKINMIKITKPDNSSQTKEFSYDGVFAQDSTQQQVYDDAAFSLIQSVLEGYNGTIFAYGQTGCGKTHTMVGVKNDPAQNGIIPKAFSHIFGCIDAATDDKRFLVRCSYLEIYNEGIHDLLGDDGSRKLALKQDPQKGIFVQGLNYTICSNVEEIDKIMQAGSSNRHTGETLMNKDSSRSHSIFTIYIEMAELSEDGQNQKIRAGKLNLVDLAGSERQSKTGATGDRLNEANKINLSLSALGNVISALVDGKSKHIPYRDSKLTRLLQDSLGGNTKTIMIAAISPAHYNYDETLSTLRYASRAKSIKNKPHINEDPKDALLREYENEIKKLKEMISMYEGGNAANPAEAQNEIANALMKLGQRQQANLLSGLDQSGEIIIIDKKTGKAKMRKKDENGDIIEVDVEESFDFPRRKSSFVSHTGQPVRRQSETKAKLLERQKEIEQLNKDREEIQNELKSRQEKLMVEQKQKMALQGMMEQLEHKLVRGGAALNEEQKKHAMAYRELQLKLKKQKKKEKQLIFEKMRKEDEVLMVEQHYKDLQEESEENRKNIKKLRSKYQAAVDEIKDLEQEHQRNREDLLDTIRDNERELKLYKAMVHMLMHQDDVQKVLKRCVWNESDAEWTVPQFMYKNRKVNFPTIKNAESIVQNYKDSQELAISDNQNPKPKSKWASDGGHYPSASPRVHSSQNRLNAAAEQFLPTKFSFENREAIINKFTSNLKNVGAALEPVHYANVPDPNLIHSDIALGKEDERILKPKHQRGKVQLEPINKMPQAGKKAHDRLISKQASNSSIVIPKPSGHRVGSLEKIENPPHLKKITQLKPIGATMGQNNRIDFSFKATFVLEHQESGDDSVGSAHKIRRQYQGVSPGLSSQNVVASYIQHPNQQDEEQ